MASRVHVRAAPRLVGWTQIRSSVVSHTFAFHFMTAPSFTVITALDCSHRNPKENLTNSFTFPSPVFFQDWGSSVVYAVFFTKLCILSEWGCRVVRDWNSSSLGRSMAAAMVSCRVLGGVVGSAILGRSCNADILGGRQWTSAAMVSQFGNVSHSQQQKHLRIQSFSANAWRQPASRKSFFSKDISATENGAGDDPVSESIALAGFLMLPALVGFSGTANASVLELNMAYGEMAEGLEFGVQLIYLGALLALLGVGSFLVVRQVLIRRELESAAKDLQDRVRSGEASSEEFFELGAVMLRKKYYVLANKYLEQAIKKWDGDEADLAQVYNALGFSYFSDDKVEQAIIQYEKALKLQPGYVTAWNNLGNVYEVKKDFKQALKAYEEALQFDPSNKIAQRQRDFMKERVTRLQGIPTKD